jgi:hypothetical protein
MIRLQWSLRFIVFTLTRICISHMVPLILDHPNMTMRRTLTLRKVLPIAANREWVFVRKI